MSSQFKDRPFRNPRNVSLPESDGPVTPPPFARVEPITDQIKLLLKEKVSGKEPFCHDEASTAQVPAVVPATGNIMAKMPGSTPWLNTSLPYTNPTITGLDLSTCAVTQFIRKYRVPPKHLYMSYSLYHEIVDDIKVIHGDFNGTVPCLIGCSIHYISISAHPTVPEYTIFCKYG